MVSIALGGPARAQQAAGGGRWLFTWLYAAQALPAHELVCVCVHVCG